MKTKAMFVALFSIIVLFTACEKEHDPILPSTTVSSQEYTLSDFDELQVSDIFNVYVTFAENENMLRIEANDNLHSLIEVDQYNGVLSISLDDDIHPVNTDPVLNAFVTTDDIQKIKAFGAAKIFLQNTWEDTEVEIKLTGASTLEGELQVGQIQADLLGASNLMIEGSADVFELVAKGASRMEGFNFFTDAFFTDLEGASEASLTVNEMLEVEANGASTVYYKGDGTIKVQNLSGGSRIIKID